MRYRIEKDALGEKNIPQEAYYGIGTERSKETFQLTKHGLSRQMIKSLALVKKVSGRTNGEMNIIDNKEADAICLSADEILNGRLHGQFITDILQDGYGYGMDINASEVIANRANEMLGSHKGLYDIISVEKVNLYQDISESMILVGKLTGVKLAKKLTAECKKTYNLLNDFLEQNAKSSDSLAYKQIQSVSEILEKDTKRVEKAITSMYHISIGKAIPFEGEQREKYLKKYIEVLNSQTTEKYQLSSNYLTTSNNLDCFMHLSSLVKNLMINFSRSMSNICELASKGLIIFPKVQDVPQSSESILLGLVKQVSYYIVGNDMTVSRTVEEGLLTDNPYLAIIYASLYECINLVRRTIRTIKEKVFEVMTIK